MVQNIQIEKLVNSYHLSFFFRIAVAVATKLRLFGGFQTVCILGNHYRKQNVKALKKGGKIQIGIMFRFGEM